LTGKKKTVRPATDPEVPTHIKNPDLVREKRRHIIDSTVNLFIEHGYHKTTTRMIAKAAGFSIGSLYEYVSSKEDLLYLVCHTIHEEVKIAVERALKSSHEDKDQLADAVREYFYVCDKMADHILLMYQVTQFLPEKWKQQVLENELDITRIFIDLLHLLCEKQIIPVLDETVLNLVGNNISVLGQMWAFRRWHIQKDFTIEEYIRIQTRFILGLLF
jgi:AcrR family transcriptional regulator